MKKERVLDYFRNTLTDHEQLLLDDFLRRDKAQTEYEIKRTLYSQLSERWRMDRTGTRMFFQTSSRNLQAGAFTVSGD